MGRTKGAKDKKPRTRQGKSDEQKRSAKDNNKTQASHGTAQIGSFFRSQTTTNDNEHTQQLVNIGTRDNHSEQLQEQDDNEVVCTNDDELADVQWRQFVDGVHIFPKLPVPVHI